MNTLLASTQEATNDNFPTINCSSYNVADCFCNHNCKISISSYTFSGVTLSVKSSELNNTPMKVMQVLGRQAFSFDSSNPHESKTFPSSSYDFKANSGASAPAWSSR